MEYYLVNSGDEAIGYFAYNEDATGQLFLSKIYIKDTCRNTGKGREAFAFIIQQAAKNNCKKIWLTVNKNNRASIDKYLRMGFTITESVKTDIGSGFYMDDYVMEYTVAGR
jgi:ribosomal protein S18 acetylase RimI-like enzyme